ncbi:MAG TPA: ATP-binding cassette domain-containing protein, partial [Nannocystis exedens]|nr:ATP-binding cassette domain-containing protein [Nannocystis exedens]
LLSCIAGTTIADSGEIAIAGHDLKTAPIRARAALRYLPQEIELPAGLSGRELLELHAAIFAAPLTNSAIEFAALGESLDHLATTYSVGMRRRLLLAALSLGEAALWVADEPFAGLDRPSQIAAIALLRARAAAGAGILLAAHDADEPWLQALDAKTLFLHNGHLHDKPDPK